MNAATATPRPSARSMDRNGAGGCALLAGCPDEVAAELEAVLAEEGLRCERAAGYEAALLKVRDRAFELWVLHAGGLPLLESMAWAGLRYAAGHVARRPRKATHVPVLVLAQRGSPEARGAAGAAASGTGVAGADLPGWKLGIQELPCSRNTLRAMIRELLNWKEEKAPHAPADSREERGT